MENELTPFEITVIIHHHVSPTPFPTPSIAYNHAVLKLVKAGILIGDYKNCQANQGATQVYIDAICSVPLPIQKWVIPADQK